MNDNKI